jgi:hypothetical protein
MQATIMKAAKDFQKGFGIGLGSDPLPFHSAIIRESLHNYFTVGVADLFQITLNY